MFQNAEFLQDVVSRIPMGKVGHPDDVANAVLIPGVPGLRNGYRR